MTKQNNIDCNRHSLLPIHPLGEPSPISTAMDCNTSSRLIESSAPYLIPQRRNMNSFAAHRVMPYENSELRHDEEEDLVKSQSIPIQNHMQRTASELKLCEDEEMADFRDYVFFSRVIDGIARQQRATESSWLRQENDECLAHIIGTRNGRLDSNSRNNCQNQTCANSRVNSNAPSSGEHQSRQWMNDLPEDAAVDTNSDEIFLMDL